MSADKSISLILPVPPSVNRYWRSGMVNGHVQVYLSDEAKAYKQTVQILTRELNPFTGPVALSLTVFRPRKAGDLDNTLKALLDSVKGTVYIDDDQVVEIHAFRDDDKHNPRVHFLAWET